MRPGPHPWATNNTYVGGPDVGSDTKTVTPALLREDGYYRTRRPAPDLLNWQLNRSFLAHREAARMRAKNILQTNAAAGGALTDIIDAWAYDQTNDIVYFFFYDNAPASTFESNAPSGEIWTANALVIAPGAGVFTGLDAAAAEQGLVHVVSTGINDTITALQFGGAWGAVAVAAGPALNWTAIGCDRNTQGAASYRFIIGEDGAVGGAHAPVIKESTAAVPAYTTIAGFPALAAGRVIRGIHHTQHPVEALGPDDPGNPSWLVLTDVEAVRSADAAVWTSAAHGFAGGNLTKNCAAYSRTARRWVVALQGGSAGDIEYSDDNGATWTLVAGAFTPGGTAIQVVSDGYGTFVAAESAQSQFFVSVDDGLTWETVSYPVDPGADVLIAAVASNSAINVDDAPTYSSAFFHGHSTGVNFTVQRSLRT